MAARSNDAEKIISLFQLYEQKMYHIAYAILHDSYLAEDAVMDAFVRLLNRNYPIGDPASAEVKSLIIQIIRSAAIDLYRKKQKEFEKQTLSGDPVSLAPVGTDEPERAVSGIAEAMICDLPAIYRDVIFLRYVKEYTAAETARALGISEAAVRKRQERALRMLKEKRTGNGGQ